MSDIAERAAKTPPLTDAGLEDHPMWQAYMEEMAKLRQADIAEANRLADLEELAGGADTINTSVKANGLVHSAEAEWPIPQFKHNLGDNPLWDEFMEEMQINFSVKAHHQATASIGSRVSISRVSRISRAVTSGTDRPSSRR